MLSSPAAEEKDIHDVYDMLSGRGGDEAMDVVLDDRSGKNLGWKMKDADLIGYPVVVVLGKRWKESREVEVQCRRLGVVRNVGVEGLKGEVLDLLGQL